MSPDACRLSQPSHPGRSFSAGCVPHSGTDSAENARGPVITSKSQGCVAVSSHESARRYPTNPQSAGGRTCTCRVQFGAGRDGIDTGEPDDPREADADRSALRCGNDDHHDHHDHHGSRRRSRSPPPRPPSASSRTRRSSREVAPTGSTSRRRCPTDRFRCSSVCTEARDGATSSRSRTGSRDWRRATASS